MSRVVIVEEKVGESTLSSSGAASIDKTLQAWATASVDIDGRNVREEGLDRGSIAVHSVSPADGQSLVSIPANIVYAFVGDTPYTDVIIEVKHSAPNDDQLIVRGSVAFFGGSDVTLTCKLGYSLDAGVTWTAIEKTKRMFQAFPGYVNLRGNYCVAHYFEEGGASLDAIVMFALMFDSLGLNVLIQEPSVTAVTFAR